MLFNSYSYIVALIAAVVVFWSIPAAWRRNYLLAVSVLFYASWNVTYTLLPALLCLVVWFCARKMMTEGLETRLWFYLGISAPLLLLAFFKYRSFAAQVISSLTGVATSPPLPALMLPLGISFYTFEAISFLIDTKQGRVKAAPFRDLALFVSYWPHMIAGPIVRVRELIPQLGKLSQFDSSLFLRGVDRFLWGLAQKNALANNLAGWIDEGFLPQAIRTNTTLDNWVLAFAFGLQIYFDFSSYSNMAIGASRMLGINLPENFRFPYHATDPSDFWSRWHMTLSRWIRDYLFFPINAKYQGRPLPLYMSLVTTMGLVGLWHGAGWGYILWGLLHGVYLVAFRIWESTHSKPRVITTCLIRTLTIVAVMLAWVPFRAGTIADSLTMLNSMLRDFKLSAGMSVNFYLLTAGIFLFQVAEPSLIEWFRRVRASAGTVAVFSFVTRPAIYALLLVLFLIFDDKDVQFIYFQF